MILNPVSFADLNFAVRLSTDNNIYCPNPEEFNIEKISENEIILKSNSSQQLVDS